MPYYQLHYIIERGPVCYLSYDCEKWFNKEET